MRRRHAPFALVNATLNPVIRGLLHSPAHRLLSGRLLVLTVTGRRTGNRHRFPVGYVEHDDVIVIRVAAPDRKRWWRNLLDEAPVEVLLRGRRRAGRAVARQSEDGAVTVEVRPLPD